MATRRVVVLLLAVLVVSTLAAALIPSPPEESTGPDNAHKGRSKRDDARSRSQPRGNLVVATFEAARRPETIRLRVGDELRMEIGSRTPAQIEIPAYGLIEDASPDAPARFDILIDHGGASAIRIVGSGRIVGRLVVR